jgi:hypothetical protein
MNSALKPQPRDHQSQLSPGVPLPVNTLPDGSEAPAPPKLLGRMRERVRVRRYSIRTEDTYADWVRSFILIHGKRHPRVGNRACFVPQGTRKRTVAGVGIWPRTARATVSFAPHQY